MTMIYFYLWVAALTGIIFSVPIVSFLEKSRRRKAAGPVAASEGQDAEEGVSFEDAAAEPEMADDGLGGFGKPAAADDFSAFDDFK